MPPEPSAATLLTQWTVQPLALILIVAAGGWYGLAAARRNLPVGRRLTFAAGLALAAWTTCGFPGVYSSVLFQVWTVQVLLLMLLVPFVLLAGKPLELARTVSPDGRIDRLLRSRGVRLVASPLVGPALVPLASFVLFFGPLPGWSLAAAPVQWLVQVAVVAFGAVIMLPLLGIEAPRSSLAAGLALAIGTFELVLDAVPGFVLRLHRSAVSMFFDHRGDAAWLPSTLRDQQGAGAVLWTVAELIDLPFLILIFRQWIRVDAQEAAELDAVLEAEQAARAGLPDAPESSGAPDAPWWLTDPDLQRRFGR